MTRQYYNLVTKCEGNMEARRILEESLDTASTTINAMISAEKDPTISNESSISQAAPTVLNPDYAKTKGRSKRAKSAIERKRSTENEFGSKTPNAHLF
jgi:hypothetical protein